MRSFRRHTLKPSKNSCRFTRKNWISSDGRPTSLSSHISITPTKNTASAYDVSIVLPISHTPTLKDRGKIINGALTRLEANGFMTEMRYNYYRAEDIPTINKLRLEPEDGVVIDYYLDSDHIQAESENPAAWKRFLTQYGFEDDFIDATGSPMLDNEKRAHEHYRSTHGGRDAFEAPRQLEPYEVTEQILRKRGKYPLIITLGGRSGSGKTTLLNKVRDHLWGYGVSTACISTDDYAHGKTYRQRLSNGEWTNYDANETYNLPLCWLDIRQLKSGSEVAKRSYDFTNEESRITGKTMPTDVILVEGIKAIHPMFQEIADLSFTIPTSLALSIGRRIVRDLETRPRFADPSINLTTYLEYTEPEYRTLLQ